MQVWQSEDCFREICDSLEWKQRLSSYQSSMSPCLVILEFQHYKVKRLNNVVSLKGVWQSNHPLHTNWQKSSFSKWPYALSHGACHSCWSDPSWLINWNWYRKIDQSIENSKLDFQDILYSLDIKWWNCLEIPSSDEWVWFPSEETVYFWWEFRWVGVRTKEEI